MKGIEIMGKENVKLRNSNLELLRIILMFSVVMHHLVLASGLEQYYDLSNNTLNTILLQFAGAWGKTAINAYVLITGYFMCKSKLTWEKVLKLVLEIKFYEIVFYGVLVLTGYLPFSPMGVFKLVFSIGMNVNHSFTASFVAFYLFIPFFNKLINCLDKKEFQRLLVLLLIVFTGIGTFLSNFAVFSHLAWYSVLYFIAAYIRNYPSDWTESRRLNKYLFWISFGFAYISIVMLDFINIKFGIDINCYYLIMNSHKILALLISLFIFLWFKNIEIPYNRWINLVASTTFGVLLIHTNHEAMNKLIWNDCLHVTDIIEYNPIALIAYVFMGTAVVFIVCMLIDLVRINAFETPFFTIIHRDKCKIENYVLKLGNGGKQKVEQLISKMKLLL